MKDRAFSKSRRSGCTAISRSCAVAHEAALLAGVRDVIAAAPLRELVPELEQRLADTLGATRVRQLRRDLQTIQETFGQGE